MINWNSVINNVGQSTLVDFVNGNVSGRELQKRASNCSPVATLLRRNGVNRLRRSAREALRRRNVL